MGQYYSIIIKGKNGKINYNHRKIKGCDYQMAKLMEHSWMQNDLILAIVNQIYNKKCRLIWCGDYSDEDEIANVSNGEASYNKLWCNAQLDKNDINKEFNKFSGDKFDYHGKFLINHTKHEYVDFDDYIKGSTLDGWCPSPISILTAIGNGRGGGDYYGTNEDLVGNWAWDEISIEDHEPGNDFKKSIVTFRVSW